MTAENAWIPSTEDNFQIYWLTFTPIDLTIVYLRTLYADIAQTGHAKTHLPNSLSIDRPWGDGPCVFSWVGLRGVGPMWSFSQADALAKRDQCGNDPHGSIRTYGNGESQDSGDS